MDDRVAVTVLRHGLTKENEEKRYIGWTDCSLSSLGRTELQKKKQHRYPKADIVFSSDLIRCQETAAILYPNVETKTDLALRELHFGCWEGSTYGDLKDNVHYREWLDAPTEVTPLGGESFTQFQQRTKAAWVKILACTTSYSDIVIVTHGGVIRQWLEMVALEPKGFWNWTVGYGEGFCLIGSRISMLGGERCTLLQAVPSMEKDRGYGASIT